MAASRKSGTETIAISAGWQSLFITAIVVGWLSQLGSMLLMNTMTYTSAGTWAFQLSITLLPLAFFVIAFSLLGHYVHPIRRLFMACLASVIGMVFYTVVATWEMRFWLAYTMNHPLSASDASWWDAFGNDWTLMVVSLVAFGAGLYFITKKLRR